jgi:hypothetical protein
MRTCADVQVRDQVTAQRKHVTHTSRGLSVPFLPGVRVFEASVDIEHELVSGLDDGDMEPLLPGEGPALSSHPEALTMMNYRLQASVATPLADDKQAVRELDTLDAQRAGGGSLTSAQNPCTDGEVRVQVEVRQVVLDVCVKAKEIRMLVFAEMC